MSTLSTQPDKLLLAWTADVVESGLHQGAELSDTGSRGEDTLKGVEERGKLLELTAYIITATDHHFTLGVVELPEVRAMAATVAEIPGAVRAAAAEHTGLPLDDFTVAADY